MSHATGTSHPL